MTLENDYLTSWESYWSSLTGEPDEIFWDVSPTEASQKDLQLFQDSIDSRLPLVDLGCGNGTQARFLANYFPTVIGTDISPTALEIARTQNSAPNISYRSLNLVRPEQAQSLHREIGDANLYIRGVLHQLAPDEQPIAVQSIEHLLGTKGKLYFIELSSAAIPYMNNLAERYGKPPNLQRVFERGMIPGRLNEKELETLFPSDRFVLLDRGESGVRTLYRLPNGDVAEVPGFYAVLQLKSS